MAAVGIGSRDMRVNMGDLPHDADPKIAVVSPVEGWMAEKLLHVRRYHYIVDTMALCRGYGFYRGELTPDTLSRTPGREDCRACFKMLQRRRKS